LGGSIIGGAAMRSTCHLLMLALLLDNATRAAGL
jgi:hypothetical protein